MIKKLLQLFRKVEKSVVKRATHPIEKIGALTRQRIEDFYMCGRMLIQYRYWCSCGTELTEGPCGGLAVNAVCEKCRVNYGCLTGFFQH